MTIRAAALLLCLLVTPLLAQQVTEAPGVILRGLDKVTGLAYNIELARGQTASFAQIKITLQSCRYPVGNPSGEAYAALEITGADGDEVFFSGWMIASAPALSALDHARYDVWVMRCTTS